MPIRVVEIHRRACESEGDDVNPKANWINSGDVSRIRLMGGHPSSLLAKAEGRDPGRSLCVPLFLACLGLAAANNVAAAGNYDGTYSGTRRIIRSDNSTGCSTLDKNDLKLTVENNHFVTSWGGVALQVDVGADGSFDKSGYHPGRGIVMERVNGKITDGDLEADLGSTYCAVHLSLKKS